MFRILVDTCVWLDLARDSRQHPVLGVVEQMIREKMISLIVPRLVIDEFRRNRERIEKESAEKPRHPLQAGEGRGSRGPAGAGRKDR